MNFMIERRSCGGWTTVAPSALDPFGTCSHALTVVAI